MNRASLKRGLSEKNRRQELRKCQTDLYYLLTKYLKRDLLTDWHRLRCAVFDKHRHDPFLLWLAARDHYKTTVVRGMIVQDLLIDPETTILYSSANLDVVDESLDWISHQFQHNQQLRSLIPDHVPAANDSRFYVKHPSPRFALKRSRYDSAPSVKGKTTGSEITGAHVKMTIYLDDIIGLETLKDSTGMQNARDWYGTTIMNVASRGCRIRAIGTRYDLNDIYSDWLKSEDWFCLVDAAREDDNGKPDWKGIPVLLSEEELQVKERQMTRRLFALQMMNDPLPEGDRIWNPSKCEHFKEQLEDVPNGWTVILSDPSAPIGDLDLKKNKKSLDHDYWAIAVVRFVINKHRTERYLLEAVQSQKWKQDQGLEVIMSLMEKWQTKNVLIEEAGQARGVFTNRLKTLCRENGLPTPKLIQPQTINKGKGYRIQSLADIAEKEEFYVVKETINPATLELLLGQLRNFPQTKHDDLADAASFCTDQAVLEEAPKAQVFRQPFWFRAPKEPTSRRRSRHIAGY